MRTLFLLAVLAVTTWVGLEVKGDLGFALINFDKWSVTLPLWLMFWGLVGVILVLKCFLFILHLPWRFKTWVQTLGQRQSYNWYQEALVALLSANWEQANTYAKKLQKQPEYQQVATLILTIVECYTNPTSAKASLQQLKASGASKNMETLVTLWQAKVLQQQDRQQALIEFNKLQPNNLYALTKAWQLSYEIANYAIAMKLVLPMLQSKVYADAVLYPQIKNLYLKFFNQSDYSWSDKDLSAFWQQLPKVLQQDKSLIVAYIDYLNKAGLRTMATNLHKKLIGN